MVIQKKIKKLIFTYFLLTQIPTLNAKTSTTALTEPQNKTFNFNRSHLEKSKEAQEFLQMPTPEMIKRYNSKIGEWQYPSTHVLDELLGFQHASSTQARNIVRFENNVVYDVVYSFDQFGRRFNPDWRPKHKRNKFLILFGCSFVFGQGLKDNETLAHFLNAELSDYEVYNYSISATSVNVMLGLIQKKSN